MQLKSTFSTDFYGSLQRIYDKTISVSRRTVRVYVQKISLTISEVRALTFVAPNPHFFYSVLSRLSHERTF